MHSFIFAVEARWPQAAIVAPRPWHVYGAFGRYFSFAATARAGESSFVPTATLNDGEKADASRRPRRPVEDLGLPNLPGKRDKSSLGRGDTKRRTTESFSVRSAVFKGRAPKPAVRCEKRLR